MCCWALEQPRPRWVAADESRAICSTNVQRNTLNVPNQRSRQKQERAKILGDIYERERNIIVEMRMYPQLTALSYAQKPSTNLDRSNMFYLFKLDRNKPKAHNYSSTRIVTTTTSSLTNGLGHNHNFNFGST